jgi:acylpyruvate hydrolase
VRFVTFRPGKQTQLGVEIAGWIVDLACASREMAPSIHGRLPASMSDLLKENEETWQFVRKIYDHFREQIEKDLRTRLAEDYVFSVDEIEYLPPVLSPGKIICVGMNYPDPVQPGSRPDYPVLFLKPASTMIGHQQPIQIPKVSREIKIEGELAVVIGRRGKHIRPEDVPSYVAGYMIANDATASDLEKRTSQWATGKILDTFTPMGPYLVTSDEGINPNELTIKTTLNERVVQAANTREMFFGVADLVSYISQLATLEPGDVILTGSPKRNGEELAAEVLIKPGDRVSIEIENIGTLANSVVEEK